MRIWLLGVLTVVAFASNSILTRAALASQLIDPYLFSLIRISSAAAVLAAVLWYRNASTGGFQWNWKPASYLILYCFAFSVAYQFVGGATGALILFATVQFTMIGYGYRRGQRLSIPEWLGVMLSVTGFLILLLPGANKPPLVGFVLMVFAGVGWALFSISGLASKDAIRDVAQGFISSVPIALLLSVGFIGHWHLSASGVLLALGSGLFASGIGYCIWYLMLPLLSAASAAVFQLLVPVVVALMGVLFLNEAFTVRFAFSGTLVIMGLAWFAWCRNNRVRD